MDLSSFEKIIGVTFKNKDILKESLTHRSYLNENPRWGVPNNERLEYLGDAVLELAVTESLYEKYPHYNEGRLTSLRAALVNFQILAKVAREISLEKYIFLSKGEAKDAGKAREVILANAFEAILGAVYLDQGYASSKTLIERTVFSRVDEIIEKGLYQDSKSLLQEIIQEKLKVTPTYKVLEEEGPDHKKKFLVGVFFEETRAAEGEGLSKQEAESNAAAAAIKKLKNSGL